VSDDKKEVEAKQQITADLILQLYNEMLEMEDKQARKDRKVVIDVLAEHVGDWLVLDVDKDT
jgi:hypothetical protein